MDPRTKLQLEFNLDLVLSKIGLKPKNRHLAKTGLKLSPQIQVYRFRFSIFFKINFVWLGLDMLKLERFGLQLRFFFFQILTRNLALD